MDKKKIGFFGGCFNPPTIAHIELAKMAIEHVKLDKVIFVPMGNYYPKENLVEIFHRYNMLELAVKNEERLEVSNMQFNQTSINYAIDSFRKIDEDFDCEKYFIMGYDNFIEMGNWKSSDEFKKYRFIVLERKEITSEKENTIFIKTKDFNKVTSTRYKKQYKREKRCNRFYKRRCFKIYTRE